MTITATPQNPFRHIDWSNTTSAAARILRTATTSAIVNQPRLQLSYDHERGDYELGMTLAA